jgi:hypothetical protein
MNDAEQQNYLISVDENLRAWLQRTPPDTELSAKVMRAINAIGTLMESFVPDREPGEWGQQMIGAGQAPQKSDQ